jgi:hypothetical protein
MATAFNLVLVFALLAAIGSLAILVAYFYREIQDQGHR